jgi:hypothetical protein
MRIAASDWGDSLGQITSAIIHPKFYTIELNSSLNHPPYFC